MTSEKKPDGVVVHLNDHGVLSQSVNHPANSTDRDNSIPFLKGREHRLGLFLLLVLGSYNEKVEDEKYQPEGDESRHH